MEKKKLLLVAVSVGVVLMVMIGIPLAILLGSPRQSSPTLQAASPAMTIPERPAIIGAPGLVQSSDGMVTPPVRIPQEPRVGINEQGSSAVAAIQSPREPAAASPQVTTITGTLPRTAAVPDESPVKPAPRRTEPAKASTPAKSSTPAQPRAATPAPAKKAPDRPVTKPAPQPSPAKTGSHNYWVQTGAFSTQVRAEGAKEMLETKGITSIIQNQEVNGKTWYRVRVGPYLSEKEANYWLALVQSIDGFAESQVRQTQSVQ